MKTSPVIFKNLTSTDLPIEWTKHLPAEQTFTVLIFAESSELFMSDKEVAYLQDLRASGIDVERLQESIRQLETGQVDTVALENLDDFMEKL